ncbi:MAG: DUF2813 domain-containing protein, partial [Armatimonadetes bacterium]
KELSVDLDDTTVLIGENNSGKTAFLEAIRICLEQLRGRSRNVFHEYDYHLPDDSSAPADADPIEIELRFREPEPDAWEVEVIRELGQLAIVRDDDRYEVRFHLTSRFDAAAGEFTTEWSFLDADGNPMAGAARNAKQLLTLQRLAPAFYLSALRDASRHFASRGRFWRTFLSEADIPEADRKKLEKDFAELNTKLIDAHQPLANVRARLEGAKNVIDFGSGDAVAIDALPAKLFSLLSRTQVSLASRAGAKIPVERQGEGTQSLAVLLLFDAFLRSQLSDLDAIAEPITALEEPEAHLHPSAIRALMKLVHQLPGQKLVSSHSGDLLASVDATSVRRFVHRDGGIKVYQIQPATFTDEEMRKFDFHVRRTRGELLFARCWLLVEGETETTLLAGAAEALDLDLERAGVRLVEFSQTDVGMLAKVANQLGIAWYCVADDDNGRSKYESKVKANLDGAAETDRLVFPYTNVERLLCDNGFGRIYEARMSSQKPQPTSPQGTPEYWKEVLKALPKSYSKPAAALEAVLMMKAGTVPVPNELKLALEKAIALAGE